MEKKDTNTFYDNCLTELQRDKNIHGLWLLIILHKFVKKEIQCNIYRFEDLVMSIF